MKKYLIFILIVLIFISGFSLNIDKASAANLSLRDFVNLLITIGVIPPERLPIVNAYIATFDKTNPPVASIVCMSDAMLCADGTYVGRTGQNCEFVCPTDPGSSVVNTITSINALWQAAIKPSLTKEYYVNGYVVYVSGSGMGGCGILPDGREAPPCAVDYIGISSDKNIIAPAYNNDSVLLSKYISNNAYLFADTSKARIIATNSIAPLGGKCLIKVQFTGQPLNAPYSFPVKVTEMKCD